MMRGGVASMSKNMGEGGGKGGGWCRDAASNGRRTARGGVATWIRYRMREID